MKQTYTVTEVAAKLGISRPKVYKMIKDGELEKIKISNLVLISHRALENLLYPNC